MTGDIYKAMEHGPILSHVLDLIRGKGLRSAEWEGFIKRSGYAVKLVAEPGRGRLSGDVIDKLAEVSSDTARRDIGISRTWSTSFPSGRRISQEQDRP